MRSRTAQWFECKIKYEKVMEDGLQKQVVEQYAVDALSFAEAEQRITEEMSQYISGEFEVADVKKAAYKEVFFMQDGEKIHLQVKQGKINVFCEDGSRNLVRGVVNDNIVREA